MNIINHRQLVKKKANPFPKKSKDKIKKLVKKSKTGFFCTGNNPSKPFIPLPFPVQKNDKNGNFSFVIPKHGKQSMKDNFIRILFQGNAFSDFLLLEGTFSISPDKEKIQKLKKGFSSKEIEGLHLINLLLAEAYCWDAKEKKVVALSKTEKARTRKATVASEKKVRVG